MVIFLYILFIILCLVLILIVLVQDEQGDSLGGIFGGGSTTPFGSRSGNVLTRFTGFLAAAFFIICLIVGLVNRTAERAEITQDTEAQAARQRFFEPLKRDTSAPSASPAATPAPATPVASPPTNP
ncbi:MAG: preprotein translocase subunit SecG [Spirochaetales bacterium]|nr:preprotein translocase subunit SecG [Spirochaetales bacterium]